MNASLDASGFARFFEEVHGVPPFPWQQRLCEQVLQAGWPDQLDLPTGVGKTATLDIAVYALAASRDAASRTHPLRLVYVVDRRTIVDQAMERAVKLLDALSEPSSGTIAHLVARGLQFGVEHSDSDRPPLSAVALRGGVPLSDLWASRPDQPTIIISTVDQVGSRLLFRGYGVSPRMQPVHAALLGNDCLYLLDEVHLSEPFRQTLMAIAGRYTTWSESAIPRRFGVLAMSATARSAASNPFALDAADHAHPVLRQRLEAQKPAALLDSDRRGLPKDFEKVVRRWIDAGARTIGVVVNRVDTAREVATHLSNRVNNTEVALLTGRMRPIDRIALEADLLPRLRSGSTPSIESRPLVVVATQCIEAGADFDFDALATECASLDALRQRFGRLNRLGSRPSAEAAILCRKESLKSDPIYGETIGSTWSWLQDVAVDGMVDFGISTLVLPESDVRRACMPESRHAPVLLPTHLDLWVQTSLPRPHPDPEVGVWLHGPERGTPDVQVIWRTDLVPPDPTDPDAEASADDEGRRRVTLVPPPASAEALAIPFAAVRAWLMEEEGEEPLSDLEGLTSAEQPRRSQEGNRWFLHWLGEGDSVWRRAKELRPGSTIVVPAHYGGLAAGTWDPASMEPVADRAELAHLRQRREVVLRLRSEVIAGLWGKDWHGRLGAVPVPREESDPHSDRDLILDWLRQEPPTEINWLPAWNALKSGTGLLIERHERMANRSGSATERFFVLRTRQCVELRDHSECEEVATTDGDQGAYRGAGVTLARHQEGVARWVERFCRALSLSDEVKRDLDVAARFHDWGKVDPRFQRLLHGGDAFAHESSPAPLAKSSVPLVSAAARQWAMEQSRYPRGARHELLSVALLNAIPMDQRPDVADWDLVLHLVASHHGHCRPWAPYVPDPEPVVIEADYEGRVIGVSSDHGLAALDSGIPERFWRLNRRYGWWGLALLEATLRLADHRRSQEEEASS